MRLARPLLGEDPRANAAYLQEAACVVTGAAVSGMTPRYRTCLALAFRVRLPRSWPGGRPSCGQA